MVVNTTWSGPQPRRSGDSAHDVTRHRQAHVMTDRLLALLLITVELCYVGYLSGAWAFVCVALAATCLGVFSRVRLRIDPTVRHLVVALLAIGFLLQHSLFPFPFKEDSLFIRTPLAHAIARFLISLQILSLFLQHENGHLSHDMAGLGVLALAFASDLRIGAMQHRPALIMILLTVGLSLALINRGRRPLAGTSRHLLTRRVLMSFVLGSGMLLGGGTALLLRAHEQTIEKLLSEYLDDIPRSVRAGFAPSGRLDDVIHWKTFDADAVCLRVYSDGQHDYLRGRAFDEHVVYSGRERWTAWQTTTTEQQAQEESPPTNLPRSSLGGRVYPVHAGGEAPWSLTEVWPEKHTRGRLLTTLDTAYLATAEAPVVHDAHHIMMHGDHRSTTPYALFTAVTVPPTQLSQEERRRLTSVDPDLDPRVAQLAAEVFRGCRSPRQHVDAARRFFHENFQYKLGTDLRSQTEDPLTYFLLHRIPAHCELFASGTALLLRLAGIPCRYVVGFVAAEHNPTGGYWIARNRDAHAWVEAYDDDSRRWVIVESTPAAGVPQPRTSKGHGQFLDAVRQRMAMWRYTVQLRGVSAVVTSMLDAAWSIPGLLLFSLLGIALIRRLGLSRKPIPQVLASYVNVELRDLHRALSRLDRYARRGGFVRQASETIGQFAGRIRATAPPEWGSVVADCYTLYGQLRYQGAWDAPHVARLVEAVRQLPRAVPRPQRAPGLSPIQGPAAP